jgi:hypothetical protein
VKKKHTGHPVALEFEHLRAVTEGDYFTTRLYTLENGPGGVYRRATRSGQGSAVNRPGAFLARWGSGLIELVRDHALEQELRAAGLDLPAEPDEPARPAVTPEQPAGPGPPAAPPEAEAFDPDPAGAVWPQPWPAADAPPADGTPPPVAVTAAQLLAQRQAAPHEDAVPEPEQSAPRRGRRPRNEP